MNKWDERFIEMAELVSTWSKDTSTQCGCVIVDDKHRVISVGYNGFPRGCDDSIDIYVDRPRKLNRVVHAEVNALLAARTSVEGCVLYVYPFPPCSQCTASIIQAGIRKVITFYPGRELQERWKDSLLESTLLAQEAGVELEYL